MSIMDYDYGLEDSDNHPLNQSGADIPLSDTEASVAEVIASKEPEDGVPVAEEVMPGKILGLEDSIQAVANKGNKQEFKDLQNQMEDNHFGKKEGIGDAIAGVAKTAKDIVKGVAKIVKGKKKVSEEDLDDSVELTEGVEDLAELDRYVANSLESLENDLLEIQSLESIRDRLVFQKGINRSIATEAMDRLENFPYRNPNMFTTLPSQTFYKASLEAVDQGLKDKAKAFWEKVKTFFKGIFEKIGNFFSKATAKLKGKRPDENEIKATKELYDLIEKLCNQGFTHNRYAGGTFRAIVEASEKEGYEWLGYRYKRLIEIDYVRVPHYLHKTDRWKRFQELCNEDIAGKLKSAAKEAVRNFDPEKNEENQKLTELRNYVKDVTQDFEEIDQELSQKDMEDAFNEIPDLCKKFEGLFYEMKDVTVYLERLYDDFLDSISEEDKSKMMPNKTVHQLSLLPYSAKSISHELYMSVSGFNSWTKYYVDLVKAIVDYFDRKKSDMNKNGLKIFEAIESRVNVLQGTNMKLNRD